MKLATRFTGYQNVRPLAIRASQILVGRRLCSSGQWVESPLSKAARLPREQEALSTRDRQFKSSPRNHLKTKIWD